MRRTSRAWAPCSASAFSSICLSGSLVAIFGLGATFETFRGGELLIIVANVCWTWFSVAAQHWLRGSSLLHLSVLTTVPGAICMTSTALAAGALGIVELRIDLAPEFLLPVLYTGTVPIALGNFLWHFGVARIGIAVASMYTNLIPVTAALVAYIWIGTHPTPHQYVGGAIIIAGVLYAQLAAMRSERHGGRVALPNGGRAPLGPISFAFDRDRFVMSLPSVWRAAGVTSELGLEKLMDGVLLHEIMHTRQSRLAAELLDPLAAAHGLEPSDDLIQEVFGKNPRYEAAYLAETAALYAAAAAPDEAAARGLAAQALHLMRARRARWLTGANAHFAELDDVFLTMEGMGQWLIYRHFVSSEGGSVPPEQALRPVRRGGRWWSKE